MGLRAAVRSRTHLDVRVAVTVTNSPADRHRKAVAKGGTATKSSALSGATTKGLKQQIKITHIYFDFPTELKMITNIIRHQLQAVKDLLPGDPGDRLVQEEQGDNWLGECVAPPYQAHASR